MPLRAFTALSPKKRVKTLVLAHVMVTLVVMLAMTLFVTLLGSGGARAQLKVRTQTINPPADATTPPLANQFVPPAQGGSGSAHTADRAPPASPPGAASPEIATDISRLPPTVLRMRDRILAAART